MLNQTLHPLTHGEMHQRQARLQMLVMADNGCVPVMSVEGGPVLPQKMIEQHVQRHSGKTAPAGRKPTALRHDPGVVVGEPVHQAMIIQPPAQWLTQLADHRTAHEIPQYITYLGRHRRLRQGQMGQVIHDAPRSSR